MGAILQVWRILDDLVTALSHPSLLRPRIEFVALRHLDVVLEAADLEAFKTLLVDTILAKLGSASEAFQVGMAELIAAVGKCMMATQRHYAKRVRVLVTSWRAVGDSESPEKDKLTEKKEDRDTEDRDTEIELTYEEKSSEKENEQVAEDLKGGAASQQRALCPYYHTETESYSDTLQTLHLPRKRKGQRWRRSPKPSCPARSRRWRTLMPRSWASATRLGSLRSCLCPL